MSLLVDPLAILPCPVSDGQITQIEFTVIIPFLLHSGLECIGCSAPENDDERFSKDGLRAIVC